MIKNKMAKKYWKMEMLRASEFLKHLKAIFQEEKNK